MSDGTGPTGKFPQGKACPDDEGEISIRIGTAHGPDKPIVVMDFGAATSWIGFPPEQVDEICRQLQGAKIRALSYKSD
jgi:hypothetical protein